MILYYGNQVNRNCFVSIKIFSWALLLLMFICHDIHSQGQNAIQISVSNSVPINRENETIEIPLKNIFQKFIVKDVNKLEILDISTNQIIPSQIVKEDQTRNEGFLLFQTSLTEKQTKIFLLRETLSLHQFTPLVFGRYVPERKDDFAWENDRIAYRMYGPALQSAGEISSGIDVWVKSTNKLIINEWYLKNDYHKDHGEGLDCYSVGPSRGCGGIGFWDGEKLYNSKNYINWKIIANGPIRIIFELSYAPWEYESATISETKRISLDAGQHLNRFESKYTSEKTISALSIAVGIKKRAGDGIVNFEDKTKTLTYWQPVDGENGNTGLAVVFPENSKAEMKDASDHYLLITKHNIAQKFIYYSGAGWSKSGYFKNAKQWEDYIRNYSARLDSPLKIELK